MIIREIAEERFTSYPRFIVPRRRDVRSGDVRNAFTPFLETRRD